jgi:DNA-binding MarR family transcriptional regulator
VSDALVTTDRPTVDVVIETMFDAFRPQMDIPAAAWELTIGQLRLMILIRRSGAVSMHRVAETFQVSQTAATGLVERVERHGFLVRRHRSDDRRVVECHLTQAGTELLDELSGLRTRDLHDALGALSDEQLSEFERLLRVIAGRPSIESNDHRGGCP